MYNTFKYNLLNNWSIVRLIRLALSLIILIQAIEIKDGLFGLLGFFFLYQALSNKGCCVNSCTTSVAKEVREAEDVEFSELKE